MSGYVPKVGDKVRIGFSVEGIVRFWEKVEKSESCWFWNAQVSNRGYGRFVFGGKKGLAHRASYQMFRGVIPKGLVIDHLCRNTVCVNPEHLEAVSQSENVRRGRGKAAVNFQKTHCVNGHELTADNLIAWSLDRGKRQCRECNRRRAREYKVRQKAILGGDS